MSRKQFKYETKVKYMKLIEEFDFEYALIEFICEFEDRYSEGENFKGRKRINHSIVRQGRRILKNGLLKYNVNMEELKSKTGTKATGRPIGGRKKKSINILNEHDRALYQEIMEEILEDNGIDPSIIQDKMIEKKKKNKSFDNHKSICEVLGINRTSLYTKLKRMDSPQKIKESPKARLQRLGVPNLIEEMCNIIIISDDTIGRDKIFKTLINNGFKITYYVFRIHFDSMEYKSRAYIRRGNKPPKEKKYFSVGANDFVKGNFNSSYPGEVLHADIKYIKINNQWGYLHVIMETYANKILAGDLSKTRDASSTISLVKKAFIEIDFPPRVFHSDHGVEYANYKFKSFLEKNGIIQSMSPKGNSLANRPSEYVFAQIQREKISLYNFNVMNFQQIYKIIETYIEGYNLDRVQSNLQYKTPQAVFTSYGACV